jgi:hypothetical protein
MEVDGGLTGNDIPSEIPKYFKVISVPILGYEVHSFTYSENRH